MIQNFYLRKMALGVALSFASLVVSAQAPVVQWDKTFGGTLDDGVRSHTQTSDNGSIIGGWSDSGLSGDKTQASKGGRDLWVIKLDSAGIKLWDKTIGGSNDDYLYSIIETTDGGYLLGSSSFSGISGDKTQASKGNRDYWLIKLDADGNILWDKTIGGNNAEELYSIAQTSDGGFIVGGKSDSGISGDKTQSSKGYYDYWIVKLDANGNKLWDKTFGGNNQDYLYTLIQTADNGFLLGGTSHSDLSGDKTQAKKGVGDYWVLKLDAAGVKLWDKTIGGSNYDDLFCLTQAPDGGYILGGSSHSDIGFDKTQASYGGYDYWLVKLDAAGNKIWDRTIGGNGNDDFRRLAHTFGGGYILAGNSDSGISGKKSEAVKGFGTDYWVVKTDASGNVVWDKTIGGNSYDYLFSITQTSTGGYTLGGPSISGISGDKSQPNRGTASTYDYWIVKLSPAGTTGIQEFSSNFNLSISPNPSHGKFQLHLNKLTAKTAAITVSDLVGRTIYQQEIPVTGNQIQQQIDLPANKGMYQLQVKTGEQTSTRKIVIE